MFTLLVDHANRTLSQLRGILGLSAHGPTFSKVGASAKPGAVQRLKYALFDLAPGKRIPYWVLIR